MKEGRSKSFDWYQQKKFFLAPINSIIYLSGSTKLSADTLSMINGV